MALALCLSTASIAPSDQSMSAGSEGGRPYTISVEVGLVVLPVVVTDRRGQSVSGLQADNFQLYEDGHPRPITLFEPEDVPATVGLVVDNSGSMLAKRDQVVAAGLAFAQSSNPLDQMFVVNFNQNVSLGLPAGVSYTSDIQQLDAALSKNAAAGNTALYDGIAEALDHLKSGARGRKALIVVSDGEDNSSQVRLPELIKRIQASNVVIDTIGMRDTGYSTKHISVLKTIAKASGGTAYFPRSVSDVTATCLEIAQDIRQQYTLGYSPIKSDANDKYHEIHVTAKAKGKSGLQVHTRAGYLMS